MTDKEEEPRIDLAKYRDAGLVEITVRYSGGGDDGCIDEVEVTRGNGVLTREMKDEVEESMYDILADLPDWCNNEGGQGHATIYVKRDLIEVQHETNFDDSKTKYFSYNEYPDGRITELRELFAKLGDKVARVLFDSQYDAGSNLAFVSSNGRRVKLDDNDLEEAVRRLLDDLADDEVSNLYTDDDWYNYELKYNVKDKSFDAEVSYTVRDTDCTGYSFKFSTGEATHGGGDDE
jgi:hypothetical protein